MRPLLDTSALHQRAIAFLAREAGVPVGEVEKLYEVERAALEASAHIRGFIPVFAIRKVRERLRRRGQEQGT